MTDPGLKRYLDRLSYNFFPDCNRRGFRGDFIVGIVDWDDNCREISLNALIKRFIHFEKLTASVTGIQDYRESEWLATFLELKAKDVRSRILALRAVGDNGAKAAPRPDTTRKRVPR